MLSIHPNSKRLHSIFSNTYASAGEYDKALEYIINDKGLGAKLQRLNIKCRKDSMLDSGLLIKSIRNETHIRIGTYEMQGIISLSNLGLDNKCSFSKNEFIEFLSVIITSNKLNSTDAQKILLYLAHYYNAINNSGGAIKALRASFNEDIKNPIPLFLMTEWLIEDHKINDANITFNKAKIVANNSLHDYSDFIDLIALKIALPNN
jgi:hypothetical protein